MNMDLYKKALDQYSVSNETTNRTITALIQTAEKKPHRIMRLAIPAIASCAAMACAVLCFLVTGVPLPPVLNHSEPLVPAETSSASFGTGTLSNDGSSQVSKSTSPPVRTDAASSQPPESILPPVFSTEPTLQAPPAQADTVIWNPVKGASVATIMYKDPQATSENYSLDKFIQYIGYNPFPKQLPKGYQFMGLDEPVKSLYFNPDGTPTDYYCDFGLAYFNGDKAICVVASKAKINVHPALSIYETQQELALTNLNGISILFREFLPPKPYPEFNITRTAELQVQDLHYYVYAMNEVTAEDFLSIVEELIN